MILSLPPVLLALTVHEYAHGYAALRMGDPTAKLLGRLTLNPLKHIDLFGLLCFVIFRFGWAKPVPFNPEYFRDVRKGIFFTSIAGPLANFAVALLFGLLLRLFPGMPDNFTFPLVMMLRLVLFFNLVLCAFNLIPVPPLDGSKVLFALLPARFAPVQTWLERYGFFVLIGMIMLDRVTGLPILWGWIGPFVSFFSRIFTGLASIV